MFRGNIMRKSEPDRISDEVRNNIINRISQIRIKVGLSAKALSREVGMHEGYISRLESKKDFLPSLEVLLKIIEVCKVSLCEFSYHNPDHYTKDMEIIELLNNMPLDKKDAFIKILKG